MARKKGNNGTRPRKNPRNNHAARGQRLRREREKLSRSNEKTDTDTIIPDQGSIESFQDVTNRGSVPTTSKDIRNPYKENRRTTGFSQNTIIIDSFSVIKTEILDPIPGLIFQDDSQYATTVDSMPIVDSSRTNQNFLLPNVKVEPGSEAPILPYLPQTNWESALSQKENIGFNHVVQYNKVIKKNVPTIKSKSICGCFEKIATIKHLCESYLEFVQQDNTNQLCLRKAGNHTLPEDMKPIEKLMKKLSRLLNLDFGKMNCCMNEIDDLADKVFEA